MTDRISFHAGYECGLKLGERCPLCKTQGIVLAYSIFSPAAKPRVGKAQSTEGFCCLGCGQQLLATMEELARAREQTEAGRPKAVLKPAANG